MFLVVGRCWLFGVRCILFGGCLLLCLCFVRRLLFVALLLVVCRLPLLLIVLLVVGRGVFVVVRCLFFRCVFIV